MVRKPRESENQAETPEVKEQLITHNEENRIGREGGKSNVTGVHT